MDIVEELLQVARVLDAAQVEYAVCGGLAVAIHGRPRLTVDIDLLVPSVEMERATAAVASAGFDLPTGWVSLADEGSQIHRLFRVTKAVGNEFMTLDLLELDGPVSDLVEDRELVVLHTQRVPVLSRSALIRMKTGSNRTKDRLDIELLNDDSET